MPNLIGPCSNVEINMDHCVQLTYKYSGMPKSERLDFRQRQNPNKGLFELAVFGFRTFGPFECSDFRQTTRLGHFIYKDGHKENFYIYKTV